MTTKLFFKRYWRVPVVALLGALIAFGGSFMLEETYTSTTRVLIRGLDANLTTTPGAPTTQTGQVDATGARSFAETQAGLASSREVAERVVDQLGLDQPKPDSGGPLHTLAKGAAWTYAHARAILTFGFYKEAERREKAIGTVQGAVSAHQLGTTSGGATGQPASYVLEITANGTTPDEARDIANASADILVDLSNERYATDSANYIASLEGQLDQTNKDVATAADAVAAYKGSHNISALDEQLVGNAQSAQSLTDQIRTTTNDIAADQGTVASLQASLAATDPTADSSSQHQTGRSDDRAGHAPARTPSTRSCRPSSPPPRPSVRPTEQKLGLAAGPGRRRVADPAHRRPVRPAAGAAAAGPGPGQPEVAERAPWPRPRSTPRAARST